MLINGENRAVFGLFTCFCTASISGTFNFYDEHEQLTSKVSGAKIADTRLFNRNAQSVYVN